MTTRTIIDSIVKKHRSDGITVNAHATVHEIATFEKRTGFTLPVDFIVFYTICNGFSCDKDIFKITPLKDIEFPPYDEAGHSPNSSWFYFAEYMIHSDLWGLRLSADGQYEIFCASEPAVTMTSTLEEFLRHFLEGNVFDQGGLYSWLEELKKKKHLQDELCIRELGYKNPDSFISIKATLTLKKTEDGGRQIGFISGYRPNHVFEYNSNGLPLQTFMGDIVFEGQSTIEPGETKDVTVRFLLNQPIEKYLTKGRKWFIHEATKVLGEAVII